MLNFCTLFDSNYLSRGLALYQSLEKVCPEFRLYVFAFDYQTYRFLKENQVSYPQLCPIPLIDLEDEQLLKVKQTRTVAEYCWTCTPSTILYCINKFNLSQCTYLDADMYFYSDPGELLDEMGEDSVLISEHRYTKQYDQSHYSGTYCVQFMCFKNTLEGLKALNWWRDRCIEWCFARLEDGKFGDQKYLDDWTTRFTGVHVLQHLGGGVAPWNVQQYIIRPDLSLEVKNNGKSYPVVFYHFHGLKFYTDNTVSFCGPLYELEDNVKEYLYFPYVKLLLEIEQKSVAGHVSGNINGAITSSPSKASVLLQLIKETIIQIKKNKLSPFSLKNFNFKRHYHIYPTEQFL